MNDLRTYYAGYRLRLIMLEQARLEMRARHWIKGEHGYFAGSYSTGGGGKTSAKAVDKTGENGIISSGNKLAKEGEFAIQDYEIEDDLESVKSFEIFVQEHLGIKYIQGVENLKNGTSALEIVSAANELATEFGKNYTQIEIYDGGGKTEIAESVMSKLRLNVQFMNRPTATQALLDSWEQDGYIPKKCNNTQYIGRHEYYHLLYHLDISNPKSSINTMLDRYSKDGGIHISDNSKKNKHEFVSDLLNYSGNNKKALKLKRDIQRLKERKDGNVSGE